MFFAASNKKTQPIEVIFSDASLHAHQAREGQFVSAQSPLRHGAISRGVLKRPEEVQRALQQLLASPADQGFYGKQAVFIVPEHIVFHRQSRFARAMPLADLERACRLELIARTPHLAQDLAFAFHPDLSAGEETSRCGSVYAMEENNRAEYESLAGELGMDLLGIMPAGYSLLTSYFQGGLAPEPLLFLHMDDAYTHLLLADIQGLNAIRVLDQGLDDLTQRVARVFELRPQQAWRLMRNLGARSLRHGSSALLRTIIKDELRDIGLALRDMRQQYQRRLPQEEDLALYLAGGATQVPALDELLNEYLALNRVSVLRPLSGPWR
jgi:Tfp pilus assembly PilM family ATPase